MNGRKAWRIESEPKTDVRPADAAAEAMPVAACYVFDEEEGIDVRRRATCPG